MIIVLFASTKPYNNENFYIMITSLGFRPSDHDSNLVLITTSHDCIVLSLYVVDMIVSSVDVDRIDELKS